MRSLKNSLLRICIDFKSNLIHIIKWISLAIVLGIICGLLGVCFHYSVDYVTELREEIEWIVYLLPIGGMAIVLLYNLNGLSDQPGTNTIIESVRQQKRVPRLLAPAIFLATVITHLVGGSSGREGAALQIGGSIATSVGRLIKANTNEMSVLITCGMTAVFSALFGTPITAAIFSLEVISIGVVYYAALLPCITCGLTAYYIAQYFGCAAVRYPLEQILTIDAASAVKLIIFAIIISVASIIFVLLMHRTHHLFEKKIENEYIRVAVGGCVLIVMIWIFGREYLGAGMGVVEKALYNDVNWYDCILKAVFTAVTIGCGFKGGEIVPTFFIGATLGYLLGTLIGLDPHVCAALGMVGLFCCVVNTPIASLMLAIEIFGINNLIPFVIVIAICFVMSDYYSLYQSQKFIYSKTNMKYVEKKAK